MILKPVGGKEISFSGSRAERVDDAVVNAQVWKYGRCR